MWVYVNWERWEWSGPHSIVVVTTSHHQVYRKECAITYNIYVHHTSNQATKQQLCSTIGFNSIQWWPSEVKLFFNYIYTRRLPTNHGGCCCLSSNSCIGKEQGIINDFVLFCHGNTSYWQLNKSQAIKVLTILVD
jgi:hypothetical protein